MTRINLIPPQELHRKHLQAEYFELPRVFTAVRKLVYKGKHAEEYFSFNKYVLGPGHVKFFYTRLGFLDFRFEEIVDEMARRGMNPVRSSVFDKSIPSEWYGWWTPNGNDIELSRSRINERLLTMKV